MTSQKKAYILTVEVGNPDVDLDASVRAAIGWMSEDIDPDGWHDVTITVTDAAGNFVTEHEYIHDEET